MDGAVGPYAVCVAALAGVAQFGKGPPQPSEWCAVVLALMLAFVRLASVNSFVDFVVPTYAVAVVALALVKRRQVEYDEEVKEEEEEEEEEEESFDKNEFPNFHGTWKMTPNQEQYNAYLEAVRVRMLLRKAIVRAPCYQILRMRADKFEVTTKSIMSLKTVYHVGGPPTKSKITSDHFEDTCFWTGPDTNKVLVIVKKNITKGYELTIKRELLPGGDAFHVHNHVKTINGSRPDANFTQLFTRVHK